MIDPEEAIEVYKNGGRPALIAKLCVFGESDDPLNEKMAEIVDCFIDSIEGSVGVEESVSTMSRLLIEFRTIVEDIALDLYNEKEISREKMVGVFKDLELIDGEDSQEPK